MQKNNKKAVVLIYVIFLVNITVILALIIVNNSYVFFNNVQFQDIIQKSNKNIQDKADSVFKLAKFYNSNGTWFIDNISCPNNVFMSWTTNSWNIFTTLDYNNGVISCSWSYKSKNLNIFYNSGYTNFSWAIYSWSYTNLVSWIWLTKFSDSDLTKINFSVSWLSWIDNIDDDFNSDNYWVSSTWVIFYPSNYADDDTNHRKKIFGYIDWNTINKSIFFNNFETNKVISSNSNNNDSINVKISNTSTWYAILDFDWNYDLKLVKFDKVKYINNKELIPLETIKWQNIHSGSWYIQNSWTISFLITWNEYIFDFVNNYYALFITNNNSWSLNYNLSFENNSLSWVYIVPLDDTTNDLKYLWNDVLDDSWKYSFTQFYVYWRK